MTFVFVELVKKKKNTMIHIKLWGWIGDKFLKDLQPKTNSENTIKKNQQQINETLFNNNLWSRKVMKPWNQEVVWGGATEQKLME